MNLRKRRGADRIQTVRAPFVLLHGIYPEKMSSIPCTRMRRAAWNHPGSEIRDTPT